MKPYTFVYFVVKNINYFLSLTDWLQEEDGNEYGDGDDHDNDCDALEEQQRAMLYPSAFYFILQTACLQCVARGPKRPCWWLSPDTLYNIMPVFLSVRDTKLKKQPESRCDDGHENYKIPTSYKLTIISRSR